jgi:hypothetical protein
MILLLLLLAPAHAADFNCNGIPYAEERLVDGDDPVCAAWIDENGPAARSADAYLDVEDYGCLVPVWPEFDADLDGFGGGHIPVAGPESSTLARVVLLACDNCPADHNPEQIDEDDDWRGDVCDNCLADYNPEQLDLDEDDVGDACDNCPGLFNPEQVDADENGRGDVCEPPPEEPAPLEGLRGGHGRDCACDGGVPVETLAPIAVFLWRRRQSDGAGTC